MKLKSLILILSLCAGPLFAQNTYYVNATTGNDTNDGTLWSKAFATLQPALEKAGTNDQIWVASGTYLPTKSISQSEENINKNQYKSFYLPKGVKLYGGFPAQADDNTGMSQRNWEAYQTILSGDFNDDDEDFANMDDNAYHVLILIEADEQTVVDGFTITGGNANGTETIRIGNTPVYSSSGGGIYATVLEGSLQTSPSLINVIIENNNAIHNGGGFFNFAHVGKANPTISNSIIRNNKAGYPGKDEIGIGYGGGIFNNGVTHASPVLTNVIISGNDAERIGGGFYCMAEKEAAPILTNVLISGNTAHDAAGMYCYTYEISSIPTLTNVTIVGNKSVDDGAGLASISYIGTSAPIIRNSILWGNKCTNNTTEQNPNLFNLADTGTPSIHYSFIEGEAASAATGNLDGNLDPEFINAVDAGFAPTTDGDYQLSKPSPLINKGRNDFITEAVDLAGKTRIIDETVDIGAYEYPETGGGSTNNESIFIGENQLWASGGNLFVNIKEPTTIRVYTIDGILLYHENRTTEGSKAISLPAGIYFVSLNDSTKAKIHVTLQ